MRLTADEYLSQPDSGDWTELNDGVLVLSPPPSVLLQRVSGVIYRLLSTYVAENRLGECFYEIDVHFGKSEGECDTVYRPDVICYTRPASLGEADQLRIVPTVVVEVVSPESRNRDSQTKLRDYERFGVAEYWLIDPTADAVHIYRRVGDELVEQPVTRVFESVAVPGFQLDLDVVRKSFAPTS